MKTALAIFCPLLVLILVSEAKANIRKIELSIRSWMGSDWRCGGDSVKIELTNPRGGGVCQTEISGSFDRASTLVWENDFLIRNCRRLTVTDETMVQVKTEGGYHFCPKSVSIYATDGQKFESEMYNQWYNRDTNHNQHGMIKTGIKRIVMKMLNTEDAGGQNIKIKLRTPSPTGVSSECTVRTKISIAQNEFVSWTREELNDCRRMPIKVGDRHYSTDIFIQTETAGDSFKPQIVEIEMNDKIHTLYAAKITVGLEFDKSQNNNRKSLKKVWPPRDGVPTRPRSQPKRCPANTDNACPVDELTAYKISDTQRMNCWFECPTVSSTPISTNYNETNGSGHYCVETGHHSSQYGWCCETRRISDEIPLCRDVLNNRRSNSNNVQEEQTEPVCPQNGCPIQSIQQYVKPNAGQTNQQCEPYCVKLNALTDDESGFQCRRLRGTRTIQAASFCCNDPNADTTMEMCGAPAVNCPEGYTCTPNP